MAKPDDVIVWEWFTEYQRWRPYSPTVSNRIQKFYELIKTSAAVSPASFKFRLGLVDPALDAYEIDLAHFIQVRNSTGMVRHLRQQVYSSGGVISRGFSWKWETDTPGVFQEYDVEVADILEDEHKKKSPTVCLMQFQCKLPYLIDFQNMQQIRINTNRKRKLVRETNTCTYMRVKDTQDVAIVKAGSSYPGSAPATQTFAGQSFTGVTGAFQNGAVGFGPLSAMQQAPHFIVQSGASQNGQASATISNPMAIPGQGQPPQVPPTASVSSVAPVSRRVTRSQTKRLKASSTCVKGGVVPSQTQSMSVQHLNQPLVPHQAVWHPPMAPPKDTQSKKKGTGKSEKQKTRLPPSGSIWNNEKPSINSTAGTKPKKLNCDFNHVIKGYAKVVRKPPKDEDCCICMCELTDVSGQNEECNAVINLKCTHMFHRSCLAAMYSSGTQDGSIQCPKCKTIFGVKFGNCPPGVMNYSRSPQPLPGYPHCGLIHIVYNIQEGIQGKEHPNPGQRYVTQGFPRRGFLPDNDEGEKVLSLLIKAWRRRLTFTIGTSVTTGITNAVVWNEIHHKTEINDQGGHGYPDPRYLSNVALELASQGVVDSDTEEGAAAPLAEEEDSDDDDDL